MHFRRVANSMLLFRFGFYQGFYTKSRKYCRSVLPFCGESTVPHLHSLPVSQILCRVQNSFLKCCMNLALAAGSVQRRESGETAVHLQMYPFGSLSSSSSSSSLPCHICSRTRTCPPFRWEDGSSALPLIGGEATKARALARSLTRSLRR